jgi:hypothetical protein
MPRHLLVRGTALLTVFPSALTMPFLAKLKSGVRSERRRARLDVVDLGASWHSVRDSRHRL